jgi:hypothetical protein
MVENLVESPWMCSDGPGSAPIQIPMEGFLSWERERESKRERERERDRKMRLWSGLRRKGLPAWLTTRNPSPTCAWTVRNAPADSPRCARMVRHLGADGPKLPPEHLVAPHAPATCVYSLWGDPRMVRLVRPDAPPACRGQSELLFLFSLIYSDVKSWIWIFWDHCS